MPEGHALCMFVSYIHVSYTAKQESKWFQGYCTLFDRRHVLLKNMSTVNLDTLHKLVIDTRGTIGKESH